jgi:hypothetical protein
MDNDLLFAIRRIAKSIHNSQKKQLIDYYRMTAPCGLPCFECYVHLAKENQELQHMISQVLGIPPGQVVCKGCRDEQGKCAHLPMPCNVYPCAEKKEVNFCCDCSDFPCDYLHPYADRAITWHNTKAFNLCLIKKMGLESWARNKAGSVLEVYSYGQWKL